MQTIAKLLADVKADFEVSRLGKMPKEVHNALSPARVKHEKRPGRFADGQGLYLHVSETGARWWLWRGTVHGRRRELGIGSARLILLGEAREIARAWRRIARAGGDPKVERDKGKRQALTFEEAARRVHAEHIEPHGRSAKYRQDWIASLRSYVFPLIGSRPVYSISQADVLRVLSPIWVDKAQTARLVRQRLKTTMSWARAAGYFEGVNPVDGVEEGLPKQRHQVKHFDALPYQEVPALMRRLEAIEDLSAAILQFMILTTARPGEARAATWTEIDMDARLWVISAGRMKANREHRVPLTDAALAVLQQVQGIDEKQVFPSSRTGGAMSDAALSRQFKRLGVAAVPHGMRSSFRIWVAERTTAPREIAELCLAHQVGDAVERAYARSDILEKRRQLMDQWSRFCMSAGSKGDVVELRR